MSLRTDFVKPVLDGPWQMPTYQPTVIALLSPTTGTLLLHSHIEESSAQKRQSWS